MNELIIIPLLGLYVYYAYIASDDFKDFMRAKGKLKWLKMWMGASR